MSGADGMTKVHPAIMGAWRRDPGQFECETVLDGLVFTWKGGPLALLSAELIDELDRRRIWDRMPWRFERLGIVTEPEVVEVEGSYAVMFRKLGEKVVMDAEG